MITDSLKSVNQLAPDHYRMLHAESGIDPAVIQERGYRTVVDGRELAALGLAPAQCRVPGLLLPLYAVDGSSPLVVYRPDNPRVVEEKKRRLPDGTYPCKVIKYEVPKQAGVRLDCPPRCRPRLADPRTPLWITEGQKKADKLASEGLCAVALLGVWNFKGQNDFGGTTFLADWDYIALQGREVRIVFDSDVMQKPSVRLALERLSEHLRRKGASVAAVYLPPGSDGRKVGVDDWLAAGHTAEALGALVEAPRRLPQPQQPALELLDAPPAHLRRPLMLIDGTAYAAAWLHVKKTITEKLDREGHIVRLDPPQEEYAQQLFVMRSDGALTGCQAAQGSRPAPSSGRPDPALGFAVELPEIPRDEKLWSAAGVRVYRAGKRPDPAAVFWQVVDVINTFIDFDRSLGEQQTMCEMVACYVLSTWFLDAFNVVGFLWPNGERGSGKSHLLLLVGQLAYLGEVILAGGSFPSLRDLADYGATLCFDDAESLSNAKTDPDKRNLLLAGNRRGSTVTVKELGSDKQWHTRYVNAYCARAFSAIHLPDPVLGSRTIVVPLVRTTDRRKANADPYEHNLWPTPPRKLLDDLWALGLANLAALPAYDAQVGQRSALAGRNLEPWRALLAVALWLEERGVAGLWQRMEDLAVAYQQEKPGLETEDLTASVIRALCQYATSTISTISTVSPGDIPHWRMKTSEITELVRKLVEEEDGSTEYINARRIGHKLSAMRFEKLFRGSGEAGRKWKITLRDLDRWAKSYGIEFFPPPYIPPQNGRNGRNGSNSALPTLGNEQGAPPDREIVIL
ncbi:MAG: DUF3854 domain-containing protein [Chloroflexi bacterium]|nr:DUF3854 domain-containing protein [Chloroflexota bacterium]